MAQDSTKVYFNQHGILITLKYIGGFLWGILQGIGKYQQGRNLCQISWTSAGGFFPLSEASQMRYEDEVSYAIWTNAVTSVRRIEASG